MQVGSDAWGLAVLTLKRDGATRGQIFVCLAHAGTELGRVAEDPILLGFCVDRGEDGHRAAAIGHDYRLTGLADTAHDGASPHKRSRMLTVVTGSISRPERYVVHTPMAIARRAQIGAYGAR